jgi:AraC-like DNA-binding protein
MHIAIYPPYQNLAEFLMKVGKHIGFKNSVEGDHLYVIPEHIGSGQIWYRDVLDGMAVLIVEDMVVTTKTVLNYIPDSTQPYYSMVFTNGMSGHATLVASEAGSELLFQQGAYLISSSINEIHTYESGGKNDFTCLIIFPEFIGKYLEVLFKKKNLDTSVQEKMKEVMLQIPSLTPEIQLGISALHNNSFSGELRKLYLESKVFELITLFFLQFEEQQVKKTILRTREKEQVYQAQQMLKKNLEMPPSITELSRLVGLNEYKLRLGFKELFNNTVYGYLRQQRMLKAKQLIENAALSVSEAGTSVGYSNLSHFAEAFKKEFGINPSQILH